MPLLMGAAAAEVGAAVLAPAPNPSRPLKASNDAEGWAVEGDADDDEDDAVGADMPAFMSDKSTRPPHVPAAGVGVAAFLFAPLAAAEKSPKSSCCWGAGTRIVVAAAEVGAAGAATGVGKVIGIDMGTDEDANTSKAAGGADLTGAEAAGVGMDDERPKASNEADDDDGAEDDKPNASNGTAAAAADDDDDGAGAVGAKKSMLLDDDENKSIDDEVAGAGVALVADDDDEEGTDEGGAGGALTGLILMMGAFLTAAGPPAAAAAAAAALIGAGAA